MCVARAAVSNGGVVALLRTPIDAIPDIDALFTLPEGIAFGE